MCRVALSSRVNGLPLTVVQLNQVALMGPIYLPKHRFHTDLTDGRMDR